MKPEAAKLLNKAEHAILATEALLKAGESDFAAGRAYYAMFYTAEALLTDKGLRYRKHSGVHAAYGKLFAKSGDMDSKYHAWLLEAFDRRITGDYDVESATTEEEVEELITRAREFLQVARNLLTAGKA
jgi:uncharacterized protein (UPF0332 family)